MPHLPDLPSVVKVVVNGSYGGMKTASILHAGMGPGNVLPLTQASIQALANGLRTAYKANILTLQANGFTLGSVDATQLLAAGGLFATAPGSDTGGDISSGNSPNSVACCISWHEPVHYRGGHPRTYIGGLKQGTQADTRTFTATFQTNLSNGANAFLAAVNAIGGGNQWLLGCAHYSGHWLASPGVPQFEPFSSASVNARIDTQRRRLGK